MDSTQLLLDCYVQLIAIQREQVTVAFKERYDKQIDELGRLEQKKNEVKMEINHLRMNEMLYEAALQQHSEALSIYIDELKTINSELQLILNRWYAENSSEMKQVSTQRKTLQTYGGVNYSEVISYYIDDKK